MAGKPCLSPSKRCPLTSPPERTTIQMPGARRQGISTRSETRPARATSDPRDAPARSVKAGQAAAQTSTLQHLCRFDGEMFLNMVQSPITNLIIRGVEDPLRSRRNLRGGDMTLGYLAAGPVVVGGASITAAVFSRGFAKEPLLPVLSTVAGAVHCLACSRHRQEET